MYAPPWKSLEKCVCETFRITFSNPFMLKHQKIPFVILLNVKFQFFFACDRLLVRYKPYGVYRALGKNSVFQTLRHYKN